MPLILATQETEIRMIAVQSQPKQIVHETLSRKNPSQKRADRVAQGSNTNTTKINKCLFQIAVN
jgi:hypothetical protein